MDWCTTGKENLSSNWKSEICGESNRFNFMLYDNDTAIGFDEDLSRKYIKPFVSGLKDTSNYLKMPNVVAFSESRLKRLKEDLLKMENTNSNLTIKLANTGDIIKDPKIIAFEVLVDKWVKSQKDMLHSLCEDAKEVVIEKDTLNTDIKKAFEGCYDRCATIIENFNDVKNEEIDSTDGLVVRVNKESALKIIKNYLTAPCIYSDETKADLEDIFEYKKNTLKWIDDTADTIKVMLNCVDTGQVYKEGIKILTNYGIIDEDGKLDEETIGFCLCGLCDILGIECDEDDDDVESDLITEESVENGEENNSDKK